MIETPTISANGITFLQAVWHPVTGCQRISEGCRNCFARQYAEPFRGQAGHIFAHGFDPVVHEGALDLPLRTAETTIFNTGVAADLFQPAVPDEVLDRIFTIMAETRNRHAYLITTRRPERAAEFFRRHAGYWGNVILRTSIESPRHIDRLDALRAVPGVVLKSVSFSPIGPDTQPFPPMDVRGLQAVTVHSLVKDGQTVEPRNTAVIEGLQAQCEAQGVPFGDTTSQCSVEGGIELHREPEWSEGWSGQPLVRAKDVAA